MVSGGMAVPAFRLTYIVQSRSLMPILKGEMPPDWGDDAVYSEQEETRVVRTQQWALFKRFEGPNNHDIVDELYDVLICTMLEKFFEQHARTEADLWNGGVPIQNSIREGFWRESWGEDWTPVYSYDNSHDKSKA